MTTNEVPAEKRAATSIAVVLLDWASIIIMGVAFFGLATGSTIVGTIPILIAASGASVLRLLSLLIQRSTPAAWLFILTLALNFLIVIMSVPKLIG